MDLRWDSMSGECGRLHLCGNGQLMRKGMPSVPVCTSALMAELFVGAKSK